MGASSIGWEWPPPLFPESDERRVLVVYALGCVGGWGRYGAPTGPRREPAVNPRSYGI